MSPTSAVSAFTVEVICSVISRRVFQAKYPRREAANTPNRNRYASVSRNAVVRISLPNAVTNHISRAADGVEQRALETLIDFRAQPRYVHVDDIGLWIEVIIPDVFEQHGACHHLASVLHQIFQQPELTRLQRQLLLAAHHPMGEPVEFEIPHTIGRFLGRTTTAP